MSTTLSGGNSTSNVVKLPNSSTLPKDSNPTQEHLPTLRVALPAYNEEESLEPLLMSLDKVLSRMGHPYEFIIVDDGSKDDTAAIASRLSFILPVQLIQHEVNQGLAGALRTGLAAAVKDSKPGDLIITMDSDNTHPAGLIPRMVQLIEEGHDVVIGSRFQHGARVIGVPFHRELLSIAAKLIFQLVLPISGVRDYTCGFRVYRAEVLAAAQQHYGEDFVSEKGFSCMVDVLLKLRPLRLNEARVVMGEAPMILRYDRKGGASKMRVFKTIGQTLSLVFRRRLKSN